jgi:hypothetical protein
MYALSYLAMFAIPLFGLKALRDTMPTWVAWSSAIGLAFTLFALVMTSYPFVDVVDARAYAAKILGTTVLVNSLGWVFYKSRRKVAASAP